MSRITNKMDWSAPDIPWTYERMCYWLYAYHKTGEQLALDGKPIDIGYVLLLTNGAQVMLEREGWWRD